MALMGKRVGALFRSLQLTLVLSIVVPLLLFSGIGSLATGDRLSEAANTVSAHLGA